MGRHKRYKAGDLIIVGNSDIVVEVMEYRSWEDVVVKFPSGYVTETQVGHILRGNVKDVFQPSVAGVGFIGDGKYSATDGRRGTVEYEYWSGMLRRVYDEKVVQKFPTYSEVSCCSEWHNFQNFAEWFHNHGYFDKGWHLDKDLIIPKNKTYSPEGCCIVPNEINQFLLLNVSRRGGLPTGVTYRSDRGTYRVIVSVGGKPKNLGTYRTTEEAFQVYVEGKREAARLLANKWEGLVDKRAIKRLLNFDVREYL